MNRRKNVVTVKGHVRSPRRAKKAGKPKLGSGQRFRALERELTAKKGKSRVRNPAALAAALGKRKVGSLRMEQLAAAGKRRAMRSKL